jgi:hypothetical protein
LRKYVFIVLSVLLLLTFATLVYAEEPQIKLGGRIMVRGWYFHNAQFFNSGLGTGTNAVPGEIVKGVEAEDAALWTSDISLTVDAKVSDNVQGFIELEISQGEISQRQMDGFGSGSVENVQSGSYTWGGGPSAFQSYDSKPNADMRLRQAWIQYTGSGLLGVPVGIKIGHQLITLGEKQFLTHERFGDDALVLFVNPTKELTLAAATAKLNEGLYTLPGDDIDAYVLMGTYKVNKDNTLGLYYFYADSDDLTQAFGGAYATTERNGLSFQDLGVHANGMLAGIISYALEVDAQFGKAEVQPDATNLISTDDLKYSGYGIYLKGGYKIPDTPLNLRASFAYGSGDQNGLDDNKIDEFQACMGFDSEVALDRFVHYTQIYEHTIATAALIQTLGGRGAIFGPHRNTGIANTTYFNLGADLAATQDLSLSLDGFLLRASKVGGWEELVGDDVSKSVGWEVDFKGSYKLAKNLNYFVEAGYFSPGSFYENTFVDDRNSVTQIIHGLNLTF